MDDYISREALLKDIDQLYLRGKLTLKETINSIPAADVRPVVLCKDCEWWEKQKDSAQGRCALMGWSQEYREEQEPKQKKFDVSVVFIVLAVLESLLSIIAVVHGDSEWLRFSCVMGLLCLIAAKLWMEKDK